MNGLTRADAAQLHAMLVKVSADLANGPANYLTHARLATCITITHAAAQGRWTSADPDPVERMLIRRGIRRAFPFLPWRTP